MLKELKLSKPLKNIHWMNPKQEEQLAEDLDMAITSFLKQEGIEDASQVKQYDVKVVVDITLLVDVDDKDTK